MKWALAIKTKLGNVYHAARGEGSARCDGRIKLVAEYHDLPPADGYVCARCRAISRFPQVQDAHGALPSKPQVVEP